ncbi:MAG: PAS domain S-box protein [Jaaginema sp. PMC 1080.18]|nr:PAS domain S-box protein [Jaaginema sp. PMC 1080.18]MEC4864488.1 PAS domain S-box protein [Jaaginema sp. PMC 1078.18]
MNNRFFDSQSLGSQPHAPAPVLEKLTASIPGVVYQLLLHPDGSIAFPYMSQGCRQFYELDPKAVEADGTLLLNLIHPEDLPSLQRSLQRSALTLTPWEWEGRIVLPSGKIRWLHSTSQPERLPNGDIIWNGLLMDVSDRKLAEIKLREQEEQLFSFIKYAPAAVAMFDREMRYLAASERWLKDYGLQQNIIGISHYEIFPTIPDSWREIHQRCIQGAVEKCEEDRFERENGLITWLKWEVRPWYDRNGDIGGIMMLTENITARKEAEFAHKRSERRLQSIFNQTFQFISLLAPDGTVLEANNPTIDLKIGDRDRLLKHSLVDAPWWQISPQTQAQIAQAITQASQGKLLRYEVDVLGDRDQVLTLDFSLKPILNDEQAVEFIIAEGHDISDRKRIELELQDSHRQTTNILESITDGFITMNRDWIITYVNPQGAKMLQHTPEDLLGRNHWDVFPEAVGTHFDRVYRQAMDDNQRSQLEEYYPPLEIWTEIRVYPTATGIAIFFQNITARKQAEAELKAFNTELESRVKARTADLKKANQALQTEIRDRIEAQQAQARLTAIIQATSDFVGITDSQGFGLFLNKAGRKMVGIHQQDIENGIHFNEFYPSDIIDDIIVPAIEVATTKGLWSGEALFINSQGEEIPVSQVLIAHKSDDGEVEFFSTIVRDIRDRKAIETELRDQAQYLQNTLDKLTRTQTQLVQSEKMSSLGQLVAGVAHEINNPVNFIYGNLVHVQEYTEDFLEILNAYQEYHPEVHPELEELIEEKDLEFLIEDLPKMLRSMYVGAERIREIVKSLRLFSRIDEMDVKAVNIHEGIDSTLMILHNRIKAKSDSPAIEIIKKYGDLPMVECYPGQLNQVFMNIISNAIDALEDCLQELPLAERQQARYFVSIHTQKISDRQILITIEDNGKGIPLEAQKRLFDPFYTTKPVGKGTGLGLAISQQIIEEKHHGDLTCISAPGEGTKFAITLPLKQPGKGS